jgi:hypothetical protein
LNARGCRHRTDCSALGIVHAPFPTLPIFVADVERTNSQQCFTWPVPPGNGAREVNPFGRVFVLAFVYEPEAGPAAGFSRTGREVDHGGSPAALVGQKQSQARAVRTKRRWKRTDTPPMSPKTTVSDIGYGHGSAGRFGSIRTGSAAQSSRFRRVDVDGRPRGRLMPQSLACIFRNAYVEFGILPLFPDFVHGHFLRQL